LEFKSFLKNEQYFANFIILEIDADDNGRSFEIRIFSKFSKVLNFLNMSNLVEFDLNKAFDDKRAKLAPSRAPPGQTRAPPGRSASLNTPVNSPEPEASPFRAKSDPIQAIQAPIPTLDAPTVSQVAAGLIPSMEDFLDAVDSGGDIIFNGVVMDGMPGILTPLDLNSGELPKVTEVPNTRSGRTPTKGKQTAKAKDRRTSQGTDEEEGEQEEQEGGEENQDPDDPKEPGKTRKRKPSDQGNTLHLTLA
jgi:hypothetical protein